MRQPFGGAAANGAVIGREFADLCVYGVCAQCFHSLTFRGRQCYTMRISERGVVCATRHLPTAALMYIYQRSGNNEKVPQTALRASRSGYGRQPAAGHGFCCR